MWAVACLLGYPVTMPEPAAIMVSIASLVPWPGNPRHNDGAPVEAVVDSIRRFGFGAPVLARRETGEIIAGHTRVKAAQAKVEKLGSIVVNEKTKMPVDNPYIAVRDRTARTMMDLKLRTGGLWRA